MVYHRGYPMVYHRGYPRVTPGVVYTLGYIEQPAPEVFQKNERFCEEIRKFAISAQKQTIPQLFPTTFPHNFLQDSFQITAKVQ